MNSHSWKMKRLSLFLFPVVSFGLWITTDWITDWTLSHSRISNDLLQTDLYPDVAFVRSLTLVSIHARIDRSEAISEVTLITNHASLQRLEFKLPLTEPAHLESALAYELGTTPDAIRSLLSYRFD